MEDVLDKGTPNDLGEETCKEALKEAPQEKGVPHIKGSAKEG